MIDRECTTLATKPAAHPTPKTGTLTLQNPSLATLQKKNGKIPWKL
jgi:hypothetical protein